MAATGTHSLLVPKALGIEGTGGPEGEPFPFAVTMQHPSLTKPAAKGDIFRGTQFQRLNARQGRGSL